MKISNLLVLGALALVGCGGVEGTYTLDKAETKKSMEADIAKLPANEQEMAKFGLAMVDAMDATLEIKSGGVTSMKTTMSMSKDAKDAKTNEEAGTWKKDGDDVVLTASGKDMKCAKSGKKLSCSAGDAKSKMTMVFAKS